MLERIAYGLYNMGLDIRRRATENVALIRRSLGEHTAIVRAIEVARARRGRGRDGRPSRPHRSKHAPCIEEDRLLCRFLRRGDPQGDWLRPSSRLKVLASTHLAFDSNIESS